MGFHYDILCIRESIEMAKKKTVTRGRPKKGNVNKSEAVREFMASHPDAKPKEVSAALAKKGIKVTPQAVSTIRFQAAKKAGAKSGRRGKTKSQNGMVQVDTLVQAKQFVDKMGGVESAKQALNVLARLT